MSTVTTCPACLQMSTSFAVTSLVMHTITRASKGIPTDLKEPVGETFVCSTAKLGCGKHFEIMFGLHNGPNVLKKLTTAKYMGRHHLYHAGMIFT
jgi:hypothetical protein